MENNQEDLIKTKKKWSCTSKHGNGGGVVYCLGLIGAAIYYIQTAAGFWVGVLGILKAIVWPVILVYSLLKFLGL